MNTLILIVIILLIVIIAFIAGFTRGRRGKQ